MSDNLKGLVTLIQRYSVHDGPGIRTVVFLKGCPLGCLWCSNPECQSINTELIIYSSQCNGCAKCVPACPQGATSLSADNVISIDRQKCNLCMKCIEACPTRAIRTSGDSMDVNQVMEEVRRDEVFYRHSGGGVTVSGGEPLFQWQFTLAFLRACKEENINTALETCGYASWDIMNGVLPFVDMVLFDIKHTDSQKHKEYTGKSNNLILLNAHRLGESGKRLWVRLPLIPGYNDSPENLLATAALAKEIKAEKVSILPYHELGTPKNEGLDREYPLKDMVLPDDEFINRAREIIQSAGVKATIGS
ncbi:glycyl-radical enzyme activating protein [Chloroflexota bacterium]